MMQKGVISVIVPVYNVSGFIKSCIDSILSQSYRNFELILIDDGSNDGSDIICDMYAAIDNRIKVIHKKNEGVSIARNVGLNIASGEWITFVDADDNLGKDSLQVWISNAKKYNTDIVVSLNKINLNINGTEYIIPSKRIRDNCISAKSTYSILQTIIDLGMSIWGKLFHSTILKTIHFIPGIPHYEDYMYIWDIAKKEPSYIVIDYVGYIANYRANSASRVNTNTAFENRFKSLAYSTTHIEQLYINNKLVSEYLISFIITESFANRILYKKIFESGNSNCYKVSEDLYNSICKLTHCPFIYKKVIRKLLSYLKSYRYPLFIYIVIKIIIKIKYSLIRVSARDYLLKRI